MSLKEKLIKRLFDLELFKVGEFKLKSGVTSSYYVDLRDASRDQKMFEILVDLLEDKTKSVLEMDEGERKVELVGVPYGAVPVAGALADRCKLAYCPVRKENKDYGNQTSIKDYSRSRLIIIEDVMSSGSSIIETIQKLEASKVSDVIVIVNRQLGGEENIKKEYPHIRVHSVLHINELLNAKNNQDP